MMMMMMMMMMDARSVWYTLWSWDQEAWTSCRLFSGRIGVLSKDSAGTIR